MRFASALLVALTLCACDSASPDFDAGPADSGLDAEVPIDAHLHDGHVADPDGGLRVPPFAGPMRLSETDLYSDIATRTLAPGVMPYRVHTELWSDGAEKARYLLLPEGTRIDTTDPEHWVFPIGTLAFKEFRVGGRLIETRMLQKIDADRWEFVAYLWREDGTDADAVPDGTMDALGTTHDVPDRVGCRDCHRGSSDTLIGVALRQLSLGEPDDAISTLRAEDRFTAALPEVPIAAGSDTARQALWYLHANCGHCHNDVHPVGRVRDLRLGMPLALADVFDAPARRTAARQMMQHTIRGTTLGIVPGDPESSQLWVRMGLRGEEGMPARGTEVVDAEGVEAVRAWIVELGR